MAEKEKEIKVDDDLYSRSIFTYGMETMKRISTLKVLIIGMRGLGVETAKNILLSGPSEVDIFDPNKVKISDLGSNFFLSESDVDKVNRDEGCVEKLSELNKSVKVSVLKVEQKDNINDYIKTIAGDVKVYNLEIESVKANKIDSVDVFVTTPDEFIWLIANAESVLTDSFHATVFSILFHKPFCVFERKELNASYKIGSRIDTLLGLFHLEKFRNTNFSLSIRPEVYEYESIDETLQKEREKATNFLRRALSL